MASWQLSASNIGWAKEDDETVYAAMQAAGFTGLELAPTRIFPAPAYEHLNGAALFGGYLKNRWGFAVPSIQSIWYGQTGSIFSAADHEALLNYTAEAFAFAHALHCPSLVFGCPKNRTLPAGHETDPAVLAVGEEFLDRAGTLAARWGVRLALEPNAPEYTNYLNTTGEVLALLKKLDNPGLALNFDLGAVLSAGDRVADFAADMHWVSHVHISEPGLAPIQKRPEHRDLALLLGAVGYKGFVSIEMGKTGINGVLQALGMVKEIFL